jgi:hypothetical protein
MDDGPGRTATPGASIERRVGTPLKMLALSRVARSLSCAIGESSSAGGENPVGRVVTRILVDGTVDDCEETDWLAHPVEKREALA